MSYEFALNEACESLLNLIWQCGLLFNSIISFAIALDNGIDELILLNSCIHIKQCYQKCLTFRKFYISR